MDGTDEVLYLVDRHNPTGYAQVLAEIAVTQQVQQLIRTYTLGLDVISQAEAAGPVYHLLYDGHGSTRALLTGAGLVIAGQTFAYDAYGNAIGFNPADALTTLLYSGEQFDQRLQMQYLRARYYDLGTGRFNRLDPFFGNLRDPQSLHKYLYVHGDPVQGIDPTGRFLAIGLALGGLIRSTVRVAAVSAVLTAFGGGAVVGSVSYNVARDSDHFPDGIVVTFSGGAAVRGFQGGLGLGIYAEVASGKVYWFHTEVFGTAPLSAFKSRSPSGSFGFDFGVSWNTDSAQDLAGYSTTSSLPIFLLHRLSKFKRGVTSITDWETYMLTLAQYSRGSNIVNRRHGALSLTQSIGNGAAVTSFAFRSYNFALTVTHSSPLRELFDVKDLGDAAGEFVTKLKNNLAGLGAQDLTAESLAAIIDDLDDSV